MLFIATFLTPYIAIKEKFIDIPIDVCRLLRTDVKMYALPPLIFTDLFSSPSLIVNKLSNLAFDHVLLIFCSSSFLFILRNAHTHTHTQRGRERERESDSYLDKRQATTEFPINLLNLERRIV
jgi:hypothetical protein